MAASEGRELGRKSALLNQEPAPGSRTLGHPQLDRRLARLGTEVGCEKVSRPLQVAAAATQVPRTALLDEAPRPSLGKEAAVERSPDRRVVEAATSSPGLDGVAVLPVSASQAQGFIPLASGSVPPVSRGLPNGARPLQDTTQRVALPQGRSGEAAVATPGLLPLKHLEPIYVRVQSDQTIQKEKSVLCPSTVQSIVQPTEKNSKMLEFNVVNPQIIRLLPLTGTESQQFFICNSSEPTVQLLLQNPLPPLGQVSVAKISTHGQTNATDATAAVDSLSTNRVSVCSEKSLTNQEKKEKVKKPLKVKTRSGRVSQPPKYKIKDYKFIKMEDLADCHQSDSDDYSELSLEDDGDKEKAMCSLFDPLMYNLRPKLFKCQSCDKSYIGKGGLARHYKLNPDHGQQEPSLSSPTSRPHGTALLEHTRKTSVKSHASAEDKKFVQQLSSHRLYLGPGRLRRTGRLSQSKKTERSRHSGGFNRPGQFRSKSLNNMSAEHHSIFRRKTRLKELIEQSSIEDFIELAVPRLTTLITVFEFLLKKVEKKCSAKAPFPDVYKEFEELHGMVKRMCQDYFSNPELNEPMEIKNPKVAESLGITDSCIKTQQIHTNSMSACINTTFEHVFTEISGRKRATENSDEMLPVAKKTTVGNLLENIDYSKLGGMKEGIHPHQGASSTIYICPGSALVEEEHESQEQEIASDQIDQDLYDQCTQVTHETLQPSSKSGFDCSDYLNLME
uniref:Zinc finger protein 839 isoform X1 n=1 Tax=Pogona vitticeps TaxID=103695 RepID=A0ABM5FBL6_9SAUR